MVFVGYLTNMVDLVILVDLMILVTLVIIVDKLFHTRSRGVAAAVSVFVKVNQNKYKY